MEKRFQIVTDSSCDLPQALADELDLAVLPLHVLIGEHTYANYLDGREIGFREFYDKLRDGERATTSAVNVSEFTAVMEEKLKAGLDILFIGFSSGLSTTYQSGAIACGELREKYPDCVVMSARRPDEVAGLRQRIVAFFQQDLVETELFLRWSAQQLRGDIYANCEVLEERADGEGAFFRVRGEADMLARLRERFEQAG